jgi:hypothetical protein
MKFEQSKKKTIFIMPVTSGGSTGGWVGSSPLMTGFTTKNTVAKHQITVKSSCKSTSSLF